MKVLDLVKNVIVEVVEISNNGSIYHLRSSEGVVYRRFSDEVKETFSR